MRVLGVHGVGNFRMGESEREAAESLAGAWGGALRRRVVRPVDVVVAYYADLVQPADGRQGGDDSLESLDTFERELALEWLRSFDLPGGTPAGIPTALLRQYVSWLAGRRELSEATTEWFVSRFFHEVATYLREPDGPARRAARLRVADAVRKHRPHALIAHSLGSVVAYEALWQDAADVAVPLLITVGSPLALPHAVLDRLEPPHRDQPRHRPPGVGHWVNLADPGDLVAIPPKGVSAAFGGVDVDKRTLIDAFDFHLATNYLASRGVERELKEFGRRR